MAVRERPHAERPIEPQHPSRLVVERGRHDDRAVVGDGDEAAVEGGVELRREEEPVPDVEALGVARAVGPRLDVAGTEELRDRGG